MLLRLADKNHEGDRDRRGQEELSIEAIKAAVLRRLDSIDRAQIRDRLNERVNGGAPQPARPAFAPFPATPSWVRTVSAAISRFPRLHSTAKRLYRLVARPTKD